MDGAPKKRAAKVGHRKSRNGCTRCKLRRVKCNEVRPVCSHCQRLSLDCAWPEHQPAATSTSTSIPSTSIPSTSIPSTSIPSTSVPSTSVPSTSIPSTPISSIPVSSIPVSSIANIVPDPPSASLTAPSLLPAASLLLLPASSSSLPTAVAAITTTAQASPPSPTPHLATIAVSPSALKPGLLLHTSSHAHPGTYPQSYHSPSPGSVVSPSNYSTGRTEFGETSPGESHSPNEQDAQRFSAMLQTWSQNVKQEATTSQSAAPRPTSSNLAMLLDGSGVTMSDTKSAIATEAESEGLMPESRERRMLEVHLMENYISNLGMPFPGAPLDWSQIWRKKVPVMARRYDNVLFAVMSQSATHLLRQEPRNHDLFRARQAYLVSAMRVQRRMISTLTLDSADAVCISALFMLAQAFAMLDERALEPYTTPMDWLRLGNGAGAVIWMSVQAMIRSGVPDQSIMYNIATAEPRMGFNESYFDACNREIFKDLLSQDLPSGDDWSDADTREAYEKTLSYIGCLQLALDNGEPIHILSRRMQGFTMVMPPRFVDFVDERRPRALVILAHFFAVVSQFKGGAWWFGGEDGKPPIAKRELQGLQRIIPPEWTPHMVWPMRTAGLWS